MNWPWRRAAREAELAEELRTHLEMAAAERMERGESPEAARDAARREFGNLTHVAEVTREMWGGAAWEALLRDLRQAARGLRRAPGFTSVAVATFALGIGATTAMFTVVDGALLKPLPFAEPDRLVLLSRIPAAFGPEARGMGDRAYAELAAAPSHAFAAIASFSGSQATLTGAGDAERIVTAQASASLLPVLGVAPALGRAFTAAEEAAGEPVVLLSDRLWRERFGGDRAVLGRPIVLDGVPRTVIGVMPASFDFPSHAVLWTPLPPRPDPNLGVFRPVVARLSTGTTLEAARTELAATLGRLPSTAAEAEGSQVTTVRPLLDLFVARARSSLWIFSGAVALVLLIACANVANLLLIRASTRRHEIGLRTALGAGRLRIVRQLVTESALVSVLGGAAGVVLATWGVHLLLAAAPAGRIPRGAEIGMDWRVLGAAVGVSLLAGLICGLLPALAGTRGDPREVLTAGARTVAGAHDRLRRAFVVAQLALAIVLLAGAGLLLKSFLRMRAVDPGFRPGGLVTFGVSLPEAAFPGAVHVRAFHTRMLEELRHVPGVEGATLVNWIPLGGTLISGDLHIEGVSAVPKGYVVDKLVTAPGYFGTMGIRLVAGRDFDSHDVEGALPVTLVSRSVARQFWPPDGLGAIGQRLTEDGEDPQPGNWRTIVGIVDDIAQRGALEGRHGAQYFPLAQTGDLVFIRNATFAVRTRRTAGELGPSLRAAARQLNPGVALRDLRSMDDAADATVADARFEARLLGIFAALALLLAAVGTYGVIAYDVTARTREFGVRIALGAVPGDVVRLVVRRTLGLVLPGLLIGLAGALAVTRVLQRSLFEVTPTDPATLAAVAGLLLLVALLAGLGPTRRALRADPMTALRSD